MELWKALSSIPLPILFLIIICLVIVTAYIGYKHAKLKGLDGIRAETYQLMLKAEHMYTESGAGRQKLKYVVSRARLLLPSWLQFFITEDVLLELIDLWFREIKDLLDDGKINESSGPPADEDTGKNSSSDEQIDSE